MQSHYNRKPTAHLYDQIFRRESQVQDLILSSKLAYEDYLVTSFKFHPNRLFKHLKSLIKPASEHYPIFHDSIPLSDPTHKAQLFNSYFNSVFTTNDFVLPPFSQLPAPSVQLSSITVDFSDVFEALCLLDCSKAPRVDNISPGVLRLCA